MSYRGEVELDAEVVAEVMEFSGCEIAPVVSEDVVRHAESTGDALEEFHGRGGRLIRDRYSLYPFSEFIDCNQEEGMATRR